MFKRILGLSIVVLILFASASVSFAETNLTQMSFDELRELKMIVDAELLSRPEYEGATLGTGEYIIGEEIKPGTYYAISAGGYWNAGDVTLYSDADKTNEIQSSRLNNGEYSVCKLILSEGNLLIVDNNSIKINTVGFNQPNPSGTTIPVGHYTVGKEIPAGDYITHYSGNDASHVELYKSKEQFEKYRQITSYYLSYFENYVTITLEEGNIFVVEDGPIVMQKGTQTFSFD